MFFQVEDSPVISRNEGIIDHTLKWWRKRGNNSVNLCALSHLINTRLKLEGVRVSEKKEIICFIYRSVVMAFIMQLENFHICISNSESCLQ